MKIELLKEIVEHAAVIVDKSPTAHPMFQSAYTQWVMLEKELTEKEATCQQNTKPSDL